MTKAHEKLIRRAAILELEKLSLFLDTELEVTANMSIEEVEDNLREMGFNSSAPRPAEINHLIAEKAGQHQAAYARSAAEQHGTQEAPRQSPRIPVHVPRSLHSRLRATRRPDPSFNKAAHVYVSDEPLHNECRDEVKLLILEIRDLAKQERYREALALAVEATRIEPNYWRAWITYGTLLVLFDKEDEGYKIFQQVSRDFPHNPKARAAGLHGCGWVTERRFQLNPAPAVRREVSRYYEKALKLDKSRANTRASLLAHQFLLNETDKFKKLLDESHLYEGFFDHFCFEMDCREVTRKIWRTLSARTRRLLHQTGRVLHQINSVPIGDFGY
jgi:hypothetical protein